MYHAKVKFSHCHFYAKRQAGKLFLNSFGMIRQGNESRPTDCKADALTTALSLLNEALQNTLAAMHKYPETK